MTRLMLDAGGPGRGRTIGVVGVFSSLLIHVFIAFIALAAAAHVRHLVSMDTDTIDAVDARAVDARHAPAHASGTPTRATMLMRYAADAVAFVASLVQGANQARLRFAIEKLIDHLWQSTLVAAVAGLLAFACRRNRARVRYALWFGASIKFFIPFSLLTALGSTLAWPPALATQAREPFVSVVVVNAVMPGTWIAAAASPAASPSASPSAPQAATRDWRGIALLGIWGCGFLAIASTRVRMWRRLRDTLETSTPLQLPDISIPAPVRVRAAAGVLEPGVIGWRQPVLLMPADIDQHLAPAEIEAIVAHELCHIDRRDNLTARMHMAAEAIFWFHPLVWWIGGRLVDERERACDEAVLRTSTSPRAYAQAILNVCKRYTTSPLASVSGVSSAHVRQRIDAILDHRIGEPLSVSKRLLLGAAIVLVAIVPLGAGAINAAHADVQPRALLRVQSFALIVSRNDGESGQPDQLGPNLTRSTRTDCNAPAPNASPCGTHASSPGTIAADSITISQLTDLIANALQQRVDDRTGLTGRFDVHLTWTPDAGGGPSLFTAVREQLGLKLQPVVAIDRAPED